MDPHLLMYLIAAVLNLSLSVILVILIRRKTEWPPERKRSLIIFSLIAPVPVLILFGNQFRAEI